MAISNSLDWYPCCTFSDWPAAHTVTVCCDGSSMCSGTSECTLRHLQPKPPLALFPHKKRRFSPPHTCPSSNPGWSASPFPIDINQPALYNPPCVLESQTSTTRPTPARRPPPPRWPRCGHPTTWTILQQDGPYHPGLWYNVLPEHQMALITSGCAPCSRSPSRPGPPQPGRQAPGRCSRSTEPSPRSGRPRGRLPGPHQPLGSR